MCEKGIRPSLRVGVGRGRQQTSLGVGLEALFIGHLLGTRNPVLGSTVVTNGGESCSEPRDAHL